MSTRHASDDYPLSQERYMSSPEYAELRGVMGGAVTAKATITLSANKRSLLFFLQALSLEPGGLRAVAQQLVEMFPDRLGTKEFRALHIRPGQKLTTQDVKNIYRALNWSSYRIDLVGDDDRAVNFSTEPHDADYYLKCVQDVDGLATALMDLCINPRVIIQDGEDDITRDRDIRRAIERHTDLRRSDFTSELRGGFQDLCGALFEFQARYAKAAAESIAKTNVAKKVHQTLDACVKARRMVLIEGESDSGKSTSAEAWCRMHKGEARFVRLQGVTNKTVFFRAIARALGLASSYMRTAKEMQARVEDMLQRSGLMLVLDESQYAFAQSERIYSRPEIVDWIYTALCNYGVPVALVASPLFSKRLHQAERQTIWNSDQFKRRIYRYEVLPPKPTRNDIELIVKHSLPDGDASAQKFLAGYAATASHPFTAIADTLADAAQIAEAAGRARVTLKDIQEAVGTFRTSSELAKRQAFDEPRRDGKRRNTKMIQGPLTVSKEPLKEFSTEEDFTGRRPVAALEETHPAKSGRAPAFQDA